MDWNEVVASQALKVLCASGGCLAEGELIRRLRCQSSPDRLAPLLQDTKRFTVVTREEAPSAAPGTGGGGDDSRVVVATTGARLCREHRGGKCAGGCRQLHLCSYFVYGGCRLQGTGKQCKFLHDFHLPPNLSVLKEHALESLDSDELCQLLLQNDSSLLPEICTYYNKGDGPYGSCTFKKICIKLHICQYYLQGECRFGSNCKRSHDIFNPECFEKLEKRGMSRTLIAKLPLIYKNMFDIKNSTTTLCKEKRDSSRIPLTVNTREELDVICLYHIRRSCSFQDKCTRIHFHLPYKWQISDGTQWKDLPQAEKIEEAYSDPFNKSFSYACATEKSKHPDIDLCNMTCGTAAVRRLSTASSVTKPPHYILTTEWLWYWEDEYGVWNEYGKQDVDHSASTVSGFELEKAYQSEVSPTIKFFAGKHEYELTFKAMKQKNLRYSTERKVRRRPKFVSLKEVEKKKARGPEQLKSGPTHIPDHWDKSALPEIGYKLVTLPSNSNEFRKVQVNFQRTMPKAAIVKIKRIQNLSLWEVFQWQKEQMKKANGGKEVDERLLFHGTTKIHIDPICHQNFDWRICGNHGIAYGKGSYFAKDASYSDNYCNSLIQSPGKTMFLARVLVGEFTSGQSAYLRPPAKDSLKQNFYDSCVNSCQNPTIFVIFEKHQIYPEYLIDYKN